MAAIYKTSLLRRKDYLVESYGPIWMKEIRMRMCLSDPFVADIHWCSSLLSFVCALCCGFAWTLHRAACHRYMRTAFLLTRANPSLGGSIFCLEDIAGHYSATTLSETTWARWIYFFIKHCMIHCSIDTPRIAIWQERYYAKYSKICSIKASQKTNKKSRDLILLYL